MSPKTLVCIVLLGGCAAALAQPAAVPTPVPTPAVAAAPAARLALPRPTKPYAMEPGYRIVTEAGQPPVVGQHMLRLASGEYRLYLKFASGQQQWLTYATSKDGVTFAPSNQWLSDAPFLAGERMSAQLVNVSDGQILAAYSVPSNGASRIDLASSKDGQKWQAVASRVLNPSGQAGDSGPIDPCIIAGANGLVMYYVRTVGGVPHVFSATSQDGYTWTAVPQSCLTNGPQFGLASLANPTVAQMGDKAYFMAVAATDAAGRQFVGMAVSADGATFQYLGSLGQLLDLSAYKTVACPQVGLMPDGTLRVLLTVTNADGTSGVVSATLPAAAVQCVPAP